MNPFDQTQAAPSAKPSLSGQLPVQSTDFGFSLSDRVCVGVIAAVMMAIATIGVLGGAGHIAGLGAADADKVSVQQLRERAGAFAKAAPLALRLVSDAEMPTALAAMNLPENEKASLAQALSVETSAEARRPLRLAWMTLWDTDAQDGDRVRIDSSGFSTIVTLANAPVTLAVPVPDQGVVNLTGVRDGGGGITVGAMSGAQRVALPIMSVGQVLGVPVVAR